MTVSLLNVFHIHQWIIALKKEDGLEDQIKSAESSKKRISIKLKGGIVEDGNNKRRSSRL